MLPEGRAKLIALVNLAFERFDRFAQRQPVNVDSARPGEVHRIVNRNPVVETPLVFTQRKPLADRHRVTLRRAQAIEVRPVYSIWALAVKSRLLLFLGLLKPELLILYLILSESLVQVIRYL